MPCKEVKKILLIVLTGFFLTACQKGAEQPEQAQQAMQGVPVRVAKPQHRFITEWNEFTGRFQAQERVEIRGRVSGYLQSIKFEDGQLVNKGDILFVIDQRPFKIALDSAQVRFDTANREYLRAKNLRRSGSISEETYDERTQAMLLAKADLEDAKLNMEFTEVKAPISGRISNNRIDVGNLVNGAAGSNATLLTTIVSTAPIELYFEGSETDLLAYQRARASGLTTNDRGKNLPVFVKLQDEQKFTHEGKINFIDNELAKDTGTIQVRAVFENKDQLFEPGMFARLRIANGPAADKLIVPEHIIGTELTRKYVYTLDADNKAQRQYVTLGSVTDDGFQVIRQGLSAEDRIIIAGLHMVRPGVLIIPMEQEPATP